MHFEHRKAYQTALSASIKLNTIYITIGRTRADWWAFHQVILYLYPNVQNLQR